MRSSYRKRPRLRVAARCSLSVMQWKAVILLSLFAACRTGATESNEAQTQDTPSASADSESDTVAIDIQSDSDVGGTDVLPDPCLNKGTTGATATCLQPTMSAEYYVEQANKYFDTLDLNADPESIPNYSNVVARWEWPPWLLLTGLGKQDMLDTAEVLKVGDPSTVPERDCRFFPTQPFARCYVTFEYADGPCPIYEEFVFNDAGEMTFIEAWSDLPGLRPQIGTDDPFGERGTFYRLSTRVPGLGTPDGQFDLDSEYMADASATDASVADFALRATNWWSFWFELLNSSPENFFAQGCGW